MPNSRKLFSIFTLISPLFHPSICENCLCHSSKCPVMSRTLISSGILLPALFSDISLFSHLTLLLEELSPGHRQQCWHDAGTECSGSWCEMPAEPPASGGAGKAAPQWNFLSLSAQGFVSLSSPTPACFLDEQEGKYEFPSGLLKSLGSSPKASVFVLGTNENLSHCSGGWSRQQVRNQNA